MCVSVLRAELHHGSVAALHSGEPDVFRVWPSFSTTRPPAALLVFQPVCDLRGRPAGGHHEGKIRSVCVCVCVWIRLTPDVFPQLVSDCQPENGNFGFHLFGNMEELLPVLSRPRKSRSKVCHVCLVVSQVEISLLPVRGTAQLVMVQWKHFSLRFQALSWNLNGQTCHYKWNEKKGKGGSVQVGVGLRL